MKATVGDFVSYAGRIKPVKCGKCGWYHFERSREEVVNESVRFNDYIIKQPPEIQAQFGIGPLSTTKQDYNIEEVVAKSEKCFNCGGSYKDFIDDDGKCPMGSTIQGIINRDE